MYTIQLLADNKVCSCLYVLLWGNFICRMQLQAWIAFHNRNLFIYIQIIVLLYLVSFSWNLKKKLYYPVCHRTEKG